MPGKDGSPGLQGPPGIRGQTGIPGVQGPPGRSITDSEIRDICASVLRGRYLNITSTNITYILTLFHLFY